MIFLLFLNELQAKTVTVSFFLVSFTYNTWASYEIWVWFVLLQVRQTPLGLKNATMVEKRHYGWKTPFILIRWKILFLSEVFKPEFFADCPSRIFLGIVKGQSAAFERLISGKFLQSARVWILKPCNSYCILKF